MQRRRILPVASLGATALLLMLLLGACSGVTARLPDRLPFGTARSADEGPSTELTVWTSPESDAADEWLRAQITTHVNANPAISVTLALPADYGAALDDLLDRSPTDPELPDLLLIDLFRLPQLIDAGLVTALPAEQLTADDLQPLLRTGASAGGELYCMPFEFNTLALLYNRELFDAAEIAYPRPGWTWDDFTAAAAAISALPTDHFTAYGLALPADITRWLPFLYQAGGTLLDASGAPALNPLVATQAISTYVGLVTDGPAVEPIYLETGWGGEALGIGRVGMVIEGNWTMPYLAAEHPSIAYGVAPLPLGPAGAGTLAFGACWAVTAPTGPRQAAAIALLAQMTAADALRARLPLTTAMPARASLAEEWRAQYPELTPFLDGLTTARLWQLPAALADLPRAVNRELQGVFDGDQSAQEAQEAIQDRMETLFQRAQEDRR